MRISVIIPAHNSERYIGAAIESVISQSRPVDEIVVVDDGSVDRTEKIVRSFDDAVLYQRQPNRGAGAARNAGIEAATGEVLAFLDSDDLWTVHKTRLQMGVLEKATDVDIVFGYVSQFVSPELDAEAKRKIVCPETPMAGYVPGTMIARREVFDRVGMFETGLKVGEFVAWYMHAQEAGVTSRLLQDVVMRRRIHATNTGVMHRDAYSDYIRVLKASLDRRRGKTRQ